MKFRFTVVASTILFSLLAHAERGSHDDGAAPAIKVEPKVRLNHSIGNNTVKNEVIVENSQQWAGLMQTYSAKQVFGKLKGLPGIENIQFTPGKHIVNSDYYDKTIVVSERQSSLMVRIQGAVPFSMMFKVDERLHRCKEAVLSQDTEEDGALDNWVYQDWSEDLTNITSPCRMESSFIVSGPIAIYGTMPGSTTNRMLLMNQVHFEWKLSTSYSKKNTELKSLFRLERPDFPVALKKILNWTHGDIPFADVFMSNPQRNALVQIGRVLKAKNEEILKGI